jgi:YfiH family protein
MVADCVPVLFADRAGTQVAIAHAGWRGLAGGVIENTVRKLGVAPGELLAYLGPGIGPQAFEVGADVRDAFLRRDARAATAFTPRAAGKWLADLFLLARQRLQAAGVDRIYGGGLCTYSDAARFYSYRRDRVTGRMAALLWRTG